MNKRESQLPSASHKGAIDMNFKHRGDIKWKSAMMMPEYREALRELFDSEYDVPRPVLGADQLHELDQKLHYVLEHGCEVTITYYQSQKRRLYTETGIIRKWDALQRKIILTTSQLLEIQLALRDVTELTF